MSNRYFKHWDYKVFSELLAGHRNVYDPKKHTTLKSYFGEVINSVIGRYTQLYNGPGNHTLWYTP